MQNKYKVCSGRRAGRLRETTARRGGGKWPMANGQCRCAAAHQSPAAVAAAGRREWYKCYDNSTNSHFGRKVDEGWRSRGSTKITIVNSLAPAHSALAGLWLRQWSSCSCQVLGSFIPVQSALRPSLVANPFRHFPSGSSPISNFGLFGYVHLCSDIFAYVRICSHTARKISDASVNRGSENQSPSVKPSPSAGGGT